MSYRRFARLSIVNPTRFLSEIRVFFNSKRILELLGEEHVSLQIKSSGDKRRLEGYLIGRNLGDIGFIHIWGMESIAMLEKNSIREVVREKKIDLENILNELGTPIETPELRPQVYQAEVYVKDTLDEEVKEMFRSFLSTYRDFGARWDYVI